MLWQIIRTGLVSELNLRSNPGLRHLLQENEGPGTIHLIHSRYETLSVDSAGYSRHQDVQLAVLWYLYIILSRESFKSQEKYFSPFNNAFQDDENLLIFVFFSKTTSTDG